MKVFLSVSGESYAPFVNLIYSKLKDAGLEVVRYEGGSYSPQPMLGCDYVFMIPPFSEGAEFVVGKGQHEELRHLNAKSMWNKTYMLTTHNQKAAVNTPSAVTLVGRNITSNNALPGSTDWKKGFAKVTTSNATSLHLIIDKIIDKAEMKKDDSFVLPKAWHVHPTNIEQDKVLIAWRQGDHGSSYQECTMCSDKMWLKYPLNDYHFSKYIEITYQQFEEYVLGKKPSIKEVPVRPEDCFGDPIEGGVEILHDKSGSLVAKIPNPNYKGLPFEEMKKLLIPLS